jgi:hypothetical protein
MADVQVFMEPDPDDPDCAVPVVRGTVAGRTYRFVLDTGAARTTMLADDYTAALPSLGADAGHGAFGAVTDTLVTVTELSFGPLQAPSLDVARVDGARPGARNLLGMDLIGQYRCHFRLAAGVVDVGPAVSGHVVVADLPTDSRGHVYVDVRWAGAQGVTGYACWDSGAGITIVHRGFWEAHRELFREIGTTEGTDASGTQMRTPLVQLAGAVIGQRSFGPHKAAVVDLSAANATLERPMDLVLGYPTLRQADWLFDFPAHKWALTS